MSKRLLISDMDLDGVSCIVLAMYFKEHFDMIWPADYGFEEDEGNLILLKGFDEIVITDKSINETTHKQLEDMGKKMFLFDHHDSSEWATTLTKTEVHHDMTKTLCGTKLYFNYLKEKHGIRMSPAVAKFVELVNTYDNWMDSSPLWEEALDLNRLLYKLWDWQKSEPLYAMQGFISSMLAKLNTFEPFGYNMQEEMFINEAKARELREYSKLEASAMVRRDEGNMVFALGEMGAKISICCYWYLKNHTDVDYIVIVNNFKGRNGKIHVRTARDNLNLPEFLDEIKGHAKACGGQKDLKFANALMDGRINSLPYKKVEVA